MDIQNSIQKIKGRIKPTQLQLLCVGHTINFRFWFWYKIKELQDLENKYPEYFDANSPSQRVGGATKNFQTVAHDHRMYSLDNSYSKEDLIDWENRIQKF
jgi:DNA ligase (NAD+)